MKLLLALITMVTGAFMLAGGIIAIAAVSGTFLYFLWNYMAPVYFTFLPAQYLHLPWWHCVCLLWIIQILNPFKVSGGK
jgi:hypothetical protein